MGSMPNSNALGLTFPSPQLQLYSTAGCTVGDLIANNLKLGGSAGTSTLDVYGSISAASTNSHIMTANWLDGSCY